VRIGIDVGGTFTHAVAIDAANLELVGKSRVPTTHGAAEGVARGVVDSLLRLLGECRVRPADVVLIAHSTTQATNALLEGDVASVGIIGMGAGAGAWAARRQTAIKPIPLAPGRFLETRHRFIHSRRVSEAAINAAIDALCRGGAAVIVAAEAFSVDDPANEEHVCRIAAERGLPATATHHVSRLHGLGIRTRTAVINASMIPTMLNTANMTEQAVRETGIQAPVMIMRSDGGVMDITQMRRRPILTMLSGPAAGVAAALLYARVSDGLFIEVGGTSTDISVIKNGRCQIRSAEVGGQKLHVRTLDVRTVGLAGGSLVYVRQGEIRGVGPRSCHIAALPYLSFMPPTPRDWAVTCPSGDEPAALMVEMTPTFDPLTPSVDDEHPPRRAESSVTADRPANPVAGGGPRPVACAVTPTCASNHLGLVPAGDAAEATYPHVPRVFDVAAQALGFRDGTALAMAIMDGATSKVTPIVEGFTRDYRLDPGVIRLVGGGGGASAVVPYLAKTMGLPWETVDNADVISAIGVALALVRDAIERTVIEPGEEDIRRIREEVFASVLKMGAAPDTIEVLVEVDAKRNLLRATAEGSTEIRKQELRTKALTEQAKRELVATSIGPAEAPPVLHCAAAGFEVWRAVRVVHRLWRFLPEQRTAVRVLDVTGAIRWASNHADLRESTAASAERDLVDFAESYTRYSDAGVTIPRCFVLLTGRIIDLSGLVEMKQVLEVLRIELKRHGQDAACMLLVDLQ
jgi:N-methylhydantoinase A/oxoprolinase/acetone carboxylase beta subunit